MTDAGFFRGTSADQDNRFANKQKKLFKELNASPILNTKLNMSKIDIDKLKPWIECKIKEILEVEDDLLSESIYEHLADKEPDVKNILMVISGFANENKASKFLEELWSKLVSVQENSNGVDKSNDDATSHSSTDKGDARKGISDEANNDKKNNEVSGKDSQKQESPSHSTDSASKSPKLSPNEDGTKDRPKKRILDTNEPQDGSRTPTPKRRSRSSTRSDSHSGARDPKKQSSGPDGEIRARSRSSKSHSSRSRSKSPSHSRSRSRSYSRSRSRSISHSRSRSRSHSPRFRHRSPYGGHRGRRSFSNSPNRRFGPRSRSPAGRRGFGRGPYRGSYGFQDRRRGVMVPYRGRRQSPWGPRRPSPRSPMRRRRSPSYSPRRRYSPSPPPYRRRRMSPSRSPPVHMMNRSIHSPRPHQPPMGPSDLMVGRHLSHRDMHRPLMRRGGLIDQRGYGDVQALPRHHSPPLAPMTKIADTYPIAHNLTVAAPNLPSGSGHRSPSPARKKHKKEKKHKKHKKHSSKKHSRDRSRSRSESPDKKRKKHKKHKKNKKHK